MIAFVGQALPKTDPSRPFGRTKLYKWFEEVKIGEEIIEKKFVFTALVDYFTGYKGKSHRVPNEEEINEQLPRLKAFFIENNVEGVVSVGKLSTEYALGQKVNDLREVIGKSFMVDAYGVFGRLLPVVPIAHPSGASAWYYQKDNKELVMKALGIVKEMAEAG